MTTIRKLLVLLVLVAFANVEAAPKKKNMDKNWDTAATSTTESTALRKTSSSKKFWKDDESPTPENETGDVSDMFKGLFSKPVLKKGVLLKMLVKLIGLIGIPLVRQALGIFEEHGLRSQGFSHHLPYSEDDYYGYAEPAPADPRYHYPSKLIGPGPLSKKLAVARFVSELAKRALGFYQGY